MGPGRKCSHHENRQKVCGPCGKKTVFGKIDPRKFLINEKTKGLIKKYILEEYDIVDDKYPLSICRTCYLTLIDAEKGIFKRPLPKIPNYKDVTLPKDTRSFEGLHGVSKVDTIKTPCLEMKSADVFQICNTCFQETGRGIGHVCKNPAENMLKMIDQLPGKTQEQIASALIKKKVDIEAGSSKQLRNVDLTLSNTKGQKSTILINPHEQKHASFNEESLDQFRVNSGISANQMKKMTNFIRSNVGRMSIPVNYREHMSQKSEVLRDIYKKETHEFDCEKSSVKQQRPVIYAKAEELLEAVIDHRKLQGNVIVKVMADGGQGFFKISLPIMPEDYTPRSHSESDHCDSENISEQTTCKRTRYSDGGSASKTSKLSSVHKLILLCVVPQIKESYDNVKVLFDLTEINNISFKFVSDFKLLLIINGQQTATSTFPCPYCFIPLRDMRAYLKSDDDLNVVACASSSRTSETEKPTRLKTYGDLRADYDKFVLSGKNKKISSQCHSTINPPLFDEDDDICVLQKCIIPELHILQGFVNHLFWGGLVPLVGREKALLWPKNLKLVPKNYHGEAFEGNACRKLLTEADKLQNPQIYDKVGLFTILPYIAAFKAMNKIVNCCFTSGKVKLPLDKHICELHKALKSIDNLSQTLKIHIILTHVEESLQFIEHNNGLGFWSEQTGESVHREFLKFWVRYKINSIDDELYGSKLLKAVLEFSSLHI